MLHKQILTESQNALLTSRVSHLLSRSLFCEHVITIKENRKEDLMDKENVKERNDDQGKKPGTLRLVIHYKGDNVELVSHQLVDMIPLPSDPLEYSDKEAGFWFVVKDKKKQTLYRRIIQNPIKYAVEVRSDDPDRPLSWASVEKPEGEFILMLPAFEDAENVLLFSSPLTMKDAMRPAREFASISLKGGRNRKGGR